MARIDLSKWIESDGGPLILLEKNSSTLWKGHSLTDPSSGVSDYDRACQIEDYLGLMDVGISKALVLNDEPLSTSYWRMNSETIVFVRWMWAPDDIDVSDTLSQAPEIDSWENTGLKITLSTEDLILFDSAYKVDEAEDSLSLQISKGIYAINTLPFRPNDDVSFMLHALTRI